MAKALLLVNPIELEIFYRDLLAKALLLVIPTELEIFYQALLLVNPTGLKWGHPIIFVSNIFLNSHLIQKCIQNQQQLLILYTFLNQLRYGKNIRHKDDRITSLLLIFYRDLLAKALLLVSPTELEIFYLDYSSRNSMVSVFWKIVWCFVREAFDSVEPLPK